MQLDSSFAHSGQVVWASLAPWSRSGCSCEGFIRELLRPLPRKAQPHPAEGQEQESGGFRNRHGVRDISRRFRIAFRSPGNSKPIYMVFGILTRRRRLCLATRAVYFGQPMLSDKVAEVPLWIYICTKNKAPDRAGAMFVNLSSS